MDLNLNNTLLAGDPRLVDHIVGQVKSQGIFDQCRKECIADVDTKPAYQNLQNRVEGSVNSFLRSQTWKPDLNKNQLRETLRKHIHDAAFLEVGVERIVDQVVNPKIYSVFRPQIEDVVYKFLGLERPRPRGKNGPCTLKDLLPKDLDPISPESDRNSLKDESLESIDLNDKHVNGRREILPESSSQFANEEAMKRVEDIKKEEITKIEPVEMEELKRIDEIKVEVTERIEETVELKNGQDVDENSMEFEKPLTKTASTSNLNVSFRSDDKTEEEEESPQFEPIDIMNLNESNLSNDSHLSGISELTSHRSRSPDYSNEFSRDHFDLSNHDQDSQLSKVSSNSRLSIVTDFGSSNQASSHFPIVNEDSKDKSRDNFRAIRDVQEGRYKESKFNFEIIKSKSSSQEKDSKSFKSFSSRENSRDEADSLREKNESKDGKERHESFKSKLPKSKTESRDSRRHRDRDRDRKKPSSSSSSRHSKSSTNDRDYSRDGYEKTKLKEEKPKEKEEKEEKKIKEEKKEKEDRKERDEKKDLEKKDPEKKDSEKKDPEKKDLERKDSEKQEMVQDIFKDLKDLYKEKIRELREKKELTEKEKLNKDSKTKDSKEKRDSSRDKKEHKKDHKTSKSSDRHEKSSRKSNESKDKDKEKKRDDHRSSKDSKSKSSRSEKESRAKKEGKSERSEIRKDSKSESQSKEKKQREEKKKSKDDHSSLRKNSNDRRSSDRDGSNGSNSKSSQKTSSTGKSTTTSTKETSKTNSGGDTSDGIEDSQGNTSKLATAEFQTQQPVISSVLEDIELVCPENSWHTDNLNADLNSLNEAALPLKKRPFPEDSSSPSPSPTSSTEKVKKPKFAKNFHEAKKLMKIRRRMEKQNSEQDEVRVNKSEVEKLKVEETGKGSLSNSPLPEEDITKVPDEERVQIIQVQDEECDEPYSEELISLTLEETSMIILEGHVLGQSQQKESKLSLMERSIRQSLEEMMSDQKLAENAERNIERESLSNLREDAPQAEEVHSEKDVETVKENCILSGSDEKSFEDEAEENLNVEKMEEVNEKLKYIPEEDEKEEEESVEFLNQQEAKLESAEKKDPQKENANETRSPKMELRVSMGIKQSTEDLMRNLLIEKSASSEKSSQDIRRESNRIPDRETVSEKNVEAVKEDLSKNKEHIQDDKKYKEKDHGAISPVEEEDCLYFEPDNERARRFARFLESFEKKLNLDKDMRSFGENSHEKSEPKSMAPPQLKRKLSSSPLSDILLHNANNNNDGIKDGETDALHEKGEHGLKRRKLGRPKKPKPSLSSFNPPGLLNGENFVMPLSPESDVSASSEKTSGQHPIKEEKSRTRNNQRYSSDDLYKPRPLFSSSSRRNRRSNQA